MDESQVDSFLLAPLKHRHESAPSGKNTLFSKLINSTPNQPTKDKFQLQKAFEQLKRVSNVLPSENCRNLSFDSRQNFSRQPSFNRQTSFEQQQAKFSSQKSKYSNLLDRLQNAKSLDKHLSVTGKNFCMIKR